METNTQKEEDRTESPVNPRERLKKKNSNRSLPIVPSGSNLRSATRKLPPAPLVTTNNGQIHQVNKIRVIPIEAQLKQLEAARRRSLPVSGGNKQEILVQVESRDRSESFKDGIVCASPSLPTHFTYDDNNDIESLQKGTQTLIIDAYDEVRVPWTVVARIKPSIPSDKEQLFDVDETKISSTATSGIIHQCNFDHVIKATDKDNKHDELYKAIGQPIVNLTFKGYNTCLFAYGSTGSGRSYCLLGNDMVEGLIPRICHELFEKITEYGEDNVSVEFGYYEVFCEKIYDILAMNEHTKSLTILEDPQSGPYIDNLSMFVVKCKEDILDWLEYGQKFRAIYSNGINRRSRRTHVVFTLMLKIYETTSDGIEEVATTAKVSRINIIDLAGSELGFQINEMDNCSIRQSLQSFNEMIMQLSMDETADKKIERAYKDCDLTSFLKEILGGNCRTFMLATFSQSNWITADDFADTLKYPE